MHPRDHRRHSFCYRQQLEHDPEVDPRFSGRKFHSSAGHTPSRIGYASYLPIGSRKRLNSFSRCRVSEGRTPARKLTADAPDCAVSSTPAPPSRILAPLNPDNFRPWTICFATLKSSDEHFAACAHAQPVVHSSCRTLRKTKAAKADAISLSASSVPFLPRQKGGRVRSCAIARLLPCSA